MLQYYLAQIRLFIPTTHKYLTKSLSSIAFSKLRKAACEGYAAGQQRGGTWRLRHEKNRGANINKV